ncbi:hypothetical protein [Blochmannia endosymbiont of Polyrhachis (Hedomyrma) turneri]|nr:hypothetical protein [Blochmannia endosymbiont of Polyrhachis (Hedomyrma) turneri]
MLKIFIIMLTEYVILSILRQSSNFNIFKLVVALFFNNLVVYLR